MKRSSREIGRVVVAASVPTQSLFAADPSFFPRRSQLRWSKIQLQDKADDITQTGTGELS